MSGGRHLADMHPLMVRNATTRSTLRSTLPEPAHLCAVLRAFSAIWRDRPQFRLLTDLRGEEDQHGNSHSDIALSYQLLQKCGFVRPKGKRQSVKPRSQQSPECPGEIELTQSGRELLNEIMNAAVSITGDSSPLLRPHLEATRRELQFKGRVIKRFTRVAPNQELLLCAFEESGWANEIDDPLPPTGNVPPPDRLRNVVKKLNRTMCEHVIEFGVNDHGTLATWHVR